MDTEFAGELLAQMGHRVPDKLVRFGEALAVAGHGPGVDGWPYFLEKPAKWASEYAAWTAANSPQEGDDGWGAFLDALAVIA